MKYTTNQIKHKPQRDLFENLDYHTLKQMKIAKPQGEAVWDWVVSDFRNESNDRIFLVFGTYCPYPLRTHTKREVQNQNYEVDRALQCPEVTRQQT